MPIELRICFVDQHWSWYLRDGDAVQIWTGHKLTRTLLGAELRTIIAHYLLIAEIVGPWVDAGHAGPGERQRLNEPI